MAAEFLERLGARMRERREELGLSMAEVARRMPGKVNENQVYRWENGKHQPKADTLEALAKVLDTTVATLMAPPRVESRTPDPFLAGTAEDGDRLAAIEERLGALEDQMGELVGLMTSDPERTARLTDGIVKAVERALSLRAREAGLPDRRRRQPPPEEDQRPAA